MPYVSLLRLDRPAGIWLLLWPCWWGVTLAGGLEWRLLLLFAVGAVVMRAAGCIINDLWDRKIDAQVERTKNRPLASGAVKAWQAVLVLLALLGMGAAVLWQLPLVAVAWGLLSLPLVVLYPLMKRVTWWPQLFLGITFNWGALVGWVAVAGQLNLPAVLLWLGGVFWTLGYDTLYACQDRADDARIGVKSSALRLGDGVSKTVVRFYVAAVALWALAGLAAGVSVWFYAVLGAVAGMFIRRVQTVEVDDPVACATIFKANVGFGLGVWVAMVAGTSSLQVILQP